MAIGTRRQVVEAEALRFMKALVQVRRCFFGVELHHLRSLLDEGLSRYDVDKHQRLYRTPAEVFLAHLQEGG